MSGSNENIKVCVRVRPLTDRERKAREKVVWKAAENTVKALNATTKVTKPSSAALAGGPKKDVDKIPQYTFGTSRDMWFKLLTCDRRGVWTE